MRRHGGTHPRVPIRCVRQPSCPRGHCHASSFSCASAHLRYRHHRCHFAASRNPSCADSNGSASRACHPFARHRHRQPAGQHGGRHAVQRAHRRRTRHAPRQFARRDARRPARRLQQLLRAECEPPGHPRAGRRPHPHPEQQRRVARRVEPELRPRRADRPARRGAHRGAARTGRPAVRRQCRRRRGERDRQPHSPQRAAGPVGRRGGALRRRGERARRECAGGNRRLGLRAARGWLLAQDRRPARARIRPSARGRHDRTPQAHLGFRQRCQGRRRRRLRRVGSRLLRRHGRHLPQQLRRGGRGRRRDPHEAQQAGLRRRSARPARLHFHAARPVRLHRLCPPGGRGQRRSRHDVQEQG